MAQTSRWSHVGIGVLLAASAACGEAEGPLPAGLYEYSAAHPTPGGGDSIRLAGVLVITEASDDSVAGRWEVSQLHPELDLGTRDGEAYVLMAHPTYFGTLLHRVAPAAGGYRCTGEYTWVAEGGVERSVPARCSLAPGADLADLPDTPVVLPRENPIVRPIDPDTQP